ncbi:hypothetical protein LP420_34120 [Massilia sp. B-10]|nr:hypothetical protein LP420_34120 [Massilia sp. B-10]
MLQEYAPASKCDYVTLSDGGIYDNLGINPALRTRNALDYVIVSDGGKPYQIKMEPTESGAIVLKEGLDIMMEQIRGLEFDRIQHRHMARRWSASFVVLHRQRDRPGAGRRRRIRVQYRHQPQGAERGRTLCAQPPRCGPGGLAPANLRT